MITKTLKTIPCVALCAALAACTAPTGGLFKSKPAPVATESTAQTPTAIDLRPKSRPAAPTGTAAEPLTAETATNVTEAEIKAASKPTTGPEQDKGITIASLGLLNQDGLWLSKSLVTSETQGRVVVEKTGKTINLALLPNGGASGSGSQISIAAMQALGVSITDLVELRVFTK
jgi:hypothetical protein